MSRAWVGLDVGTSSSKAVVHGDDGAVLSSARTPTVWRVQPSGADLDPGALLASAVEAANLAVAGLAEDVEVAGIGITSMGETGVLVDRHGAPVTAAIAWHDQRDSAEVTALDTEIGAEQFRRRAGKPLRGQFSLTKHRWLVAYDPAVGAAVRRFNIAEWVARGLGADEVCDRVLACRTGWFDVAAGTWWAEALAWSGAGAELMPPLVASGTPIGTVVADIAHPRLREAIVTLAGHDHQAAALGVGADAVGAEFDSCGTAEALVRTVAPTLSPRQVGALAAAGVTTDESLRSGHWSLLGGTEGGLALQRTLGVLGIDWSGLAALDDAALDDAALDDAARDGVTVSGLGTRSLTIAGIGDATRPGDVWRAAATAAAVDAVRLHDAITAIAGPHRRIVAAGGWCRSRAVLAAKRAQFGPIAVSGIDEPGALGAAILAARAAGGLAAGERWDARSMRVPS